MAKSFKDTKKKVDIANIVEDLGGRVPPQATEIEEAVLGALLLEPNDIAGVLEDLSVDCFYLETHKKIFRAIVALFSRREAVDILTVCNELSKANELEEVGGAPYISQLSLKTGNAAHLEYHSKILVQKHIQRELILFSYDVQKKAFDDTIPVDNLIDDAEQGFFSLRDSSSRRETLRVDSIIQQSLTDIEKNQQKEDGLSGIPSEFAGLDDVTYGWQESDLIILAARPAVGKTAFVLTMARNMAVKSHTPVALFSLEMPGKQLINRLLISETGLSTKKIRGAQKFAPSDWVQLESSVKALAQAPLWIDDTPALSIYEFRSKARRLVKYNNVKLIIIDYLQLMIGPPELRGMREQEVSAISRALKSIAKELSVPIIALSQLNRSVETRGANSRPQLSDLRESGAIEQDADIVMFLHRLDKTGVVEEGSVPGDTTLIIAKHRNGETRDIHMRFIEQEAKFIDVTNLDDNKDVTLKNVPSRMNSEIKQEEKNGGMEPSEEFDS